LRSGKLDLFGMVYENYGICNLAGVGILSINHNPLNLNDNCRI
jgi:hypothetical protein